jgi:hypothetical protein
MKLTPLNANKCDISSHHSKDINASAVIKFGKFDFSICHEYTNSDLSYLTIGQHYKPSRELKYLERSI